MMSHPEPGRNGAIYHVLFACCLFFVEMEVKKIVRSFGKHTYETCFILLSLDRESCERESLFLFFDSCTAKKCIAPLK